MTFHEGITEKPDWIEDCQTYWGKLLTGHYSHWCVEWDGLPIDETCLEFPACICFKEATNDLPKMQ